MHRLQVLFGHLRPAPGFTPGLPSDCGRLRSSPCGSTVQDGPDDVVVVHGLRTAIGKAKRGQFKDTTPDELLAVVMKRVLSDLDLSPNKLGDVCVGNVLQPGAGALVGRVAHFLSGFPHEVPVFSVNRQCSSGLQALLNIAGAIRSGTVDLGLACGVESMSLRSMSNPGDLSSRLTEVDQARDCLIPMGITSENVAQRFGISREKQDAFAVSSHQKAARAQTLGLFKEEIVPVQTRVLDGSGSEVEVLVSEDEGIRAGSTIEGLSKLRPAFSPEGSTTAGNSSQVSDGAAAVLLGRRSAVEALGLQVSLVLRSSAVVGVAPDIMGIGPAVAIPAALERAGLTVDDIDVFEINEAFASQSLRSRVYVHRDRDGGRRRLRVPRTGTGLNQDRNRTEPGPKQDRNWTELGLNQDLTRTEPGPKQDRTRTEPGQNRTEPGPNQDRNRTEPGPKQDRTRTETGPNQD